MKETQAIINEGMRLLGIETYSGDDVVELRVSNVAESLRAVINKTIQLKKEKNKRFAKKQKEVKE